jgi:hypothetical protein
MKDVLSPTKCKKNLHFVGFFYSANKKLANIEMNYLASLLSLAPRAFFASLSAPSTPSPT